MSGNESKVEIFKPFGEAFELTKKILFQPFDLKKWLVIGFAAWLARLGSGGGNFNFQSGGGEEIQKINDAISQIPHPFVVVGIVVTIVLVLILIVVVAWLRARGAFIFVDCIVKNRGAIAEPWRAFRNEGNSYFLFSLVVWFGLLIVAGLLSLPLVLPAIRNGGFFRTHELYLISAIAALILGLGLFVTIWALIESFMVPTMYRQRCSARKAFTAVATIIATHAAEILLYCLFWIVLALATALVACVAVCATCCIVAIPYIGTVILLPVFILLRSFSLLFLRQFAPEYDVWSDSMPPEFAAVLLALPAVPSSTSFAEG
jgi:hypothetical protein